MVPLIFFSLPVKTSFYSDATMNKIKNEIYSRIDGKFFIHHNL